MITTLRPRLALACLLALLLAAPLAAKEPIPPGSGTGVVGVEEAQLRAEYWLARLPAPDAVLMTPAQIAVQNARLLREDPSMHELAALPRTMARADVAARISTLSKPPSRPLFFQDGRPVPAEWLASLVAAANLEALPRRQALRFGLVVGRAPLRTFPDATRVFGDTEDQDIDRFQESALFAGTPVAVLHASHDGHWLFVLAPNYAAWIEARAVAIGERAAVLAYATRQPARVVLGARADTVFTPEAPALSALRLEMGQRLPLHPLAPGEQVNGQNAYTAWPVSLPVRGADGALAFAPALLPKIADTAAQPLPLTRANLVRQAFKFLGERYGWGHDYQGRDCSGFVAEVYRSLGVELPRNTGDQSKSPVLANRTQFTQRDDRAARERALAKVRAGDLLYIPGHLMMVLGHVDGKLYVIHDIQGGSYLGSRGELQRMHLNAVSVTPFAPLRFDDSSDFTDKLSTILRIP